MIVEDRRDFRRLLANLLNRQADLEVVAEVGSLRMAREHVARLTLDVILLDLNLPDGKGWDLTASFITAAPERGIRNERRTLLRPWHSPLPVPSPSPRSGHPWWGHGSSSGCALSSRVLPLWG